MSNPKSPARASATTSATARRGRLRTRLGLALGSLACAALALAAAELVVRWTSDVPFLGNSATLFAANRFGASTGNARDAEAVSFGQVVYLDHDGFRVPRPGYASSAARALLLVGDSVTFGPGVDEPETFAGRLRTHLTTWNVLNAAVIGHALPDYANVVRTLLAERDDVCAVVLVYCLNDLSSASAEEIRRSVAGAPASDPPPSSWVDRLRSIGVLARLNELLRERSKLYLLVRNRLTDPPRLYFAADRALYARDEAAVFAELAPLTEIASSLAERGIPFTVVVSPYAFQLREPSAENLLPQRLVLRFLAAHAIPAVDATPALAPLGSAAFLPYDPMHLSSAGHAAVEALLRARIAD